MVVTLSQLQELSVKEEREFNAAWRLSCTAQTCL